MCRYLWAWDGSPPHWSPSRWVEAWSNGPLAESWVTETTSLQPPAMPSPDPLQHLLLLSEQKRTVSLLDFWAWIYQAGLWLGWRWRWWEENDLRKYWTRWGFHNYKPRKEDWIQGREAFGTQASIKQGGSQESELRVSFLDLYMSAWRGKRQGNNLPISVLPAPQASINMW